MAVVMMAFAAFVLGLQLDPHRPELHRHRAQDARPGHDLVPHAAVRVGHLRDLAIIQVLATPVLGITLCCCSSSSASTGIGIFDPAPRRRPGALPALLLVLQPPGRLHHDPAGHGHHQRAGHGSQPQAHLRLPRHRLRSLAIAIISFLVWGHHMFTSGQSSYAA
jgi:hypothetical protein